jgi:ATP-dependent exoDNAse (exonuclease V) alpha subunit
MEQFKVGDRVRVVKGCKNLWFKKGDMGEIVEISDTLTDVDVRFDNGKIRYATSDQIELIEADITIEDSGRLSASVINPISKLHVKG